VEMLEVLVEELHVGQRISCSWWYIAYDDNDMSCGNSVDNNFGFLVYTVTAKTGNNTSYSVIVDLGTGKRF